MTLVTLVFPVDGLDAYYHQVKTMISEELDFLREARNINRIAANFAGDSTEGAPHERRPAFRVRFPRPIASLCTQRVMVTTFVDGVKVADLDALDARGVNRTELARLIVQVFCQQVLIDGVYHADPHPGNMLVGPEGELILLDFGAVGELSPQMREGIPELLEAAIRRDTESIIKALRKMGFLAKTDRTDVSEKVIEFFHRRFQEEVRLESFNFKDIKIDPQKGIESLVDLGRMDIGLRELSATFHIPRDFVLLERAVLLLTGVCTELDPDLSPVEVIRPYLRDFVLGNRDWAQIALESARDMALQALTLPDDLKKFLTRANRGEGEVQIKNLPRAAALVYLGLRQLAYAAMSIAAGWAALDLYLAGHARLSEYCLVASAVMVVFFFVSISVTRTK